MKYLILLLTLLQISCPSYAQTTVRAKVFRFTQEALPSTCVDGDIRSDSADSAQLNFCVNDTWYDLLGATAGLTASRALVSDANGYVGVSAVTSTELGYVSGVTSAIQTQIDAISASALTEASTSTLTNKSIDADNNTITNIDNDEIKAGAAIDASKIADGSVSSTEFQYIGSLTSDAQTQIDTKLASSLTDTYVFVGNGSNTAAGVDMTGDIDITNAGVTAIQSGVIVNADVNASAAIDASKIHDGSISNTEYGYLNGVTSALCGITDSCTQTNKTLTSPVINTGVSGTAILDEDNMASDSSTQLATQQSIKAYVDASVGAPAASTVEAKTASFTASAGYHYDIDDDLGNVTVTLPTASAETGERISFAKSNAELDTYIIVGSVDNLNIENESLIIISDGTNWITEAKYTPSAPTSYTASSSWSTNTTVTARWWKQGNGIMLDVTWALTGAPDTASLTFDLPSGLTFDTAQMTSSSGVYTFIGNGGVREDGVGSAYATGSLSDTNTIQLQYINAAGTASNSIGNIDQATPHTFGANDAVHFHTSRPIPVTNWGE